MLADSRGHEGELLGLIHSNQYELRRSKRVVVKMEDHSDPGRNDLLTHFQHMKNRNGSPLSPRDILGEAINAVVAGADTTVNISIF